jgi:hypothetical protein
MTIDWASINWHLLERIVTSLAGLSTVAVGIFAWVQIRNQRMESKERQRAAFASLYAEYLRLSSISEAWQEEDLVELSQSNALHPEDVLPPDWGTLIRLLGEVSSATAALGAMAYETVGEAARRIRLLNHLTNHFSPPAIAGPARTLEAQIKDGLHGAASVFEDAMRSAPSWLSTHEITVVHPKSALGLKVAAALSEASLRTLGDRHEPRLGPVGAWLGRRLARAARWLNPAA